MALEPADLIAPKGEIEPAWWPAADEGGNTLTRVTEWLARAESWVADVVEANRDEAARQYVYWNAYKAKAVQIASTINTKQVDGFQYSILVSQITHFNNLAKQAQAAFNGYIIVAASGESAGVRTYPSVSIRPQVVW